MQQRKKHLKEEEQTKTLQRNLCTDKAKTAWGIVGVLSLWASLSVCFIADDDIGLIRGGGDVGRVLLGIGCYMLCAAVALAVISFIWAKAPLIVSSEEARRPAIWVVSAVGVCAAGTFA